MSKAATIYVRMSHSMHARVQAEADARDESISVVIREAVREYLARLRQPALHEPSSATPAGTVAAADVLEAEADAVVQATARPPASRVRKYPPARRPRKRTSS